MEKNEIIEGNKLIAPIAGGLYREKYGFAGQMGYEFKDEPFHKKDKWGDENKTWWAEEYLKFHSSWNWLMFAVEKINKLIDEESDNWVGKILDDDFPEIQYLKITESKETVWKAVVQFAKWYNTTNPKQ